MKFVNGVKKSDITDANKRRLKQCPCPKTCYPVNYSIGINKAGTCVGIIYKSNNLDCIRECIFIKINGRIKNKEHFMTPDEALVDAALLIGAASRALDSSRDYQKYYKDLCKQRDNGDNHPAELNK